MTAELAYVALWFQGGSRHAATCAAHSTKQHLLCYDHLQGRGEGRWNVWRFSRMQEQCALHMTCFSLSITKTPPRTHSTCKFLGRDKLSPCVRVSKAV